MVAGGRGGGNGREGQGREEGGNMIYERKIKNIVGTLLLTPFV